MKIALVWAGDWILIHGTVRADLYWTGFSALGHEVLTVCRRGTEKGYPGPVKTFDDFHHLEDPHFWRNLGVDLAVMITWHRMVAYLEAAEAAGQRVIAIADSDGQVSAKLFLRAKFVREWSVVGARAAERFHLVLYYLKLYMYRWRREDRVFIRSTELSEIVVFGSASARDHFKRCLLLNGRGDLVTKLAVAPYPVDASFLSAQSLPSKGRRAVAIGRWEAFQKNAPLLARAVASYYDNGGDWEIVVAGSGGDTLFSPLVSKYPRFRYIGRVPPSEVAQLLTTSRVLLSSSRWEGAPVVAFEALAAGCTLVATPLPTLYALIDDGKSGIISKSHRTADFLRIMEAEFSAWDRGVRSTEMTATKWRERLRPENVCGEILRAI